jgi:hypothetical protein
MRQNFALPFRHHQQAAQPLRPPAGVQVEPRWDQPAVMSGRWNLSDCACCGAICARGVKALKGLVPGMRQNFALPFRHRQQAA